jgi:hypothetical protein
MKPKYLFLLICAVLLLSACGQKGILGSWTRTAVYLNGALENTAPADLTFNVDGTYNSSGSGCATSGTYEEIDEGTITMVMMQNSCPGNIALPFTITYTYTIDETEDGAEQMTTITGPQMETYVR